MGERYGEFVVFICVLGTCISLIPFIAFMSVGSAQRPIRTTCMYLQLYDSDNGRETWLLANISYVNLHGHIHYVQQRASRLDVDSKQLLGRNVSCDVRPGWSVEVVYETVNDRQRLERRSSTTRERQQLQKNTDVS